MSEELIVPDTKDWTWTAERECAECGFDASGVGAGEFPERVRALAAPWPQRLAAADARQRPRPQTWSPLEYGAHVHEVLEVFRGRFELVQAVDSPTLPNWDQDAAAIEGRYAAADPDRIGREIPQRAADLAEILSGVRDWERRCVRSDGAAFTTLTLARYLLHDLAHHLHDVGVSSD